MSSSSIESLFSRKAIRRYGEIVEEGVRNRDIQQALADGVIMRPVLLSKEGPVPGIYVTRELYYDPDRANVIAMVVTGGQAVIARHTAAVRHDLARSMDHAVQVYVPNEYRKAPPAANLRIYRTRNEAAFRVGIDQIETEFGVDINITSRARTVVDLLHGGRRLDDDYRTGLEALATFLTTGGETGEIRTMAQSMGLDNDDYISRMLDAAYEASRTGGPSR